MDFFRCLARNKNFVGYMFILPSVCVLLFFEVLPLIASFFSSFLNFDILLSHITFVGTTNYFNVLQDDRFWNSLWNTLYFTLGTVPIQIILSLFVANVISNTNRLNVIFRTVYFLPVVCSMTVIALALMMLLDFNIGYVPALLRSGGIPVIDLFNSQTWAMPTIILISVYKSFGFSMIILIAALQGVPKYLYEAAEIDGAGSVTKFFKISLPSIAPTISFTVITSIIGSFQVFDQVYLTTKGGPLFHTETVVQYIYERAFMTNEMPFATANAFLLFILILIATLISMRISRRSEQAFSRE